MKHENKNYVIVRGDHSGVFFGELKERSGQEVELLNARKLWYWDGASAVEQLAKDGVARPENCKFTVTVEEMTITDAIQIIPCTNAAQKSISGVAEWRC